MCSFINTTFLITLPPYPCFHEDQAHKSTKGMGRQEGRKTLESSTTALPVPQPACAHLCGGGCAPWGSLRWKSSSCSTGTWRPWCQCEFWCEQSVCSSRQRPGNTVDTWRASRGCGSGCGAQGHWASGTPLCSRDTRATVPRSPHEWSLQWQGKGNSPDEVLQGPILPEEACWSSSLCQWKAISILSKSHDPSQKKQSPALRTLSRIIILKKALKFHEEAIRNAPLKVANWAHWTHSSM